MNNSILSGLGGVTKIVVAITNFLVGSSCVYGYIKDASFNLKSETGIGLLIGCLLVCGGFIILSSGKRG